MEDIAARAVQSDEELRQANDLMAKGFVVDYFSALDWLEQCGAGYPGFEREHTRVVVSGNEVVGALRINTDTIRIGEARLKTGGLAWVTTAGTHRHKGICSALMSDALRYLARHRYHVAMLFGIPNFYHRFGFATALCDYRITVELREASAAAMGSYRSREAKPGDIAALQAIHAANDSGIACSLLRNGAHFTNKWPQRGKSVTVLTTEQGKVAGYWMGRAEGNQLLVEETGTRDASACEPLLASCARVAATECVGAIQFQTPPPTLSRVSC